MLQIAPKFEWLRVLTKDGRSFGYRIKRSELDRKRYSVPAIYQWVLTEDSGSKRFLIGETDDLYERISSYKGSGCKGHRRFRESFDRVCDTGGNVELEILQFEPFQVWETIVSANTLWDPFVRLILENLCCAQAIKESRQLMNAAGEERLKGLVEEMQRRKPEKLAQVLADASRFPRQGTASAVP